MSLPKLLPIPEELQGPLTHALGSATGGADDSRRSKKARDENRWAFLVNVANHGCVWHAAGVSLQTIRRAFLGDAKGDLYSLKGMRCTPATSARYLRAIRDCLDHLVANPLTYETLLSAYEKLTEGNETRRKFRSWNDGLYPKVRQIRTLLQGVLDDHAGDKSSHPIMAALVLFAKLLSIYPFAEGNEVMAHCVFAAALRHAGVPYLVHLGYGLEDARRRIPAVYDKFCDGKPEALVTFAVTSVIATLGEMDAFVSDKVGIPSCVEGS